LTDRPCFLNVQDSYLVDKRALLRWLHREFRQNAGISRPRRLLPEYRIGPLEAKPVGSSISSNEAAEAENKSDQSASSFDATEDRKAEVESSIESVDEEEIINNRDLECPHGRVNPAKMSLAKRISQVGIVKSLAALTDQKSSRIQHSVA
jgi:hypothetical protein